MSDTRVCRQCKETKPAEECYLTPSGNRGNYCKPCMRTMKNEFNKKVLKDRRQEQFDRMVNLVGKKCPLCLTKEADTIDHCHTSGKVRGLLCEKCNLALGNFNDDPLLVKNAINYVIKNSEYEPFHNKSRMFGSNGG